MAEDGELGVGAVHPHSVVGDADEADASVGDGHLDVFAVGVEGVFDQFLNDRSRTFYYLACCDLGYYLAFNSLIILFLVYT
jgi:hypothetical protein